MDMEWEDAAPVVVTVPWAKAHITVNKDRKPRLNMSFSEATLNACGHPKAANIQFGRASDGGCVVRLVWDPKGKFKVRDLAKGGARISAISVKEPIPDGARDAESCEPVKKDTTEAIFVLPLKAWQAQLNRPAPPATPKPVASTRPPTDGPLDACAYLRGKGVKIARMAGEWWNVNGAKVPKTAVLDLVNGHRKHADLKPLILAQIE